jgi:putative flippase GtrA
MITIQVLQIARSRVAAVSTLAPYLNRPLLRWVVVGGIFEVIGIPLLYLLHGLWLVPLPLATLLVAELTTLPRFFVNDRFVYGEQRPSWQRLCQYHVACAGGFGVWYAMANALPLFGLHYVIASVCATACSVGFAMASNFGWIWRRRSNGGANLARPEIAIPLS